MSPYRYPSIRACAALALGLAPGYATAAIAPAAAKPNIVVILADDMGYSDIGSYGSEIKTPNLDTLAANGVRFTQFYNGARCCPSRAALMSGLYAHQAGQGAMTTNQTATAGEGYAGGLNRRCVTLAEVLKTAGYATYMSGKWHLVAGADHPGSDQAGWPRQRGFDRYFGTIHGGANYFTGMNGNGNKLVSGNDTMPTPAGFYMTDNIADTAVKFIGEHFRNSPARPFFLYAAFTAPHWPLQAPKADIDRYRDRYVDGWEALRAERHARQKQLGILDPSWPPSPPDAPDWNGLSPAMKDTMALKMAIYAAQVDRLDRNIGKIVAGLKAGNALANTLIVFLSDNGACAEGGDFGFGPNSNLETRQGYVMSYGQGWAHASNTPFSLYKHNTLEGGISSPFIVHWPAAIPEGGGLVRQPGHLIDLMPTFLEVSGAAYPKAFQGNLITPYEGRSLVKAFAGADFGQRTQLFWEHEDNKAVRDGKWKLASNSGGPWRLFDMEADRTELNDLSGAQAARVSAMDSAWKAWAERAFVVKRPGTVATRLEITAPAADEKIPAGSSYTLLWGATTDTVKSVRLYYQVNGGAWSTLIDSIPNSGAFAWKVPGTAAADARVRIVSVNGKWKDTSGVFSIVPPTPIRGRSDGKDLRIRWRTEMNGLRFTDIPERSVVRVFDAAGVSVWSAAEIQGQAFWDYQGIGARSGSSFAYLVEIAGPGYRSRFRGTLVR